MNIGGVLTIIVLFILAGISSCACIFIGIFQEWLEEF